MTRLLFVFLDDMRCMPDLLKAWKDIGVPGVTIIETVGAHRARTWLSLVGLDNIDRLFESRDVRRRALLAAIDDEALLDRAVAEADRVVGGFERPNSGLLLVLPVAQARGLVKTRDALEGRPPAPMRAARDALRDTPVETIAAVLGLEPTIVTPDTLLEQVAHAMLAHPNVHVACVVSEDGRLRGLLNLRSLADHLLFRVVPEDFLGSVTDLQQVTAFASEGCMRTAVDAMQKPVWVKPGESARDAFRRMRENNLSGLPIVDDQYRVTGYVNMLELLAVCVKPDELANRVEGD